MLLLTLFLISPILALPSNTDVKPYDLEDEVLEQIEQLRSVVFAEISVGINSLDAFIREVYVVREEALTEGTVAIEQEYNTLQQQLTTIKDLALSAGKDIDSCLTVNEPFLQQIFQETNDSLVDCRAFANIELTVIMNDARYYIQTMMTDVNVFEFQVALCQGDFLCISPLLEEIELAKVHIPEKIGVEVQKASDLYDELKLLIKDCTDAKIAHFSTEGGNIVSEITECVNKILS